MMANYRNPKEPFPGRNGIIRNWSFVQGLAKDSGVTDRPMNRDETGQISVKPSKGVWLLAVLLGVSVPSRENCPYHT